MDPEWIESLNTVMDDNKVLTLVSQERIPLTPEMRLLLEVSNLRNATPATVSRGGVLFINEADVGWRPYFDSWMVQFRARNDENARNVFSLGLQQYLSEGFFDDIHSKEQITPMVDISYIMTMCAILDALYSDLYTKKESIEQMKSLQSSGKEDDIKVIYEALFIFAVMWAFGGCMTEDKISFNNLMKSAAKIKFPEAGQCFDYFFDPFTLAWTNWNANVKAYDHNFDAQFQSIVVPTADTTRHKFLLGMHMKQERAVLYVGKAGTGKTTII